MSNQDLNRSFVAMLNQMGTADIYSLTLVLNAYIDNCHNVLIDDIGYNNYTGDSYLELENGIIISSCFGRDVEYHINYLGMEEIEDPKFSNYQEALEHLEAI